MGSTTLVVNSYDNKSALIRAKIHPEAVKMRWKQVDLISRLSDVYQSLYSVIYLVHVHGHQNSGRQASTLTPLASLNVRLDSLTEHIMAEFLILSAKRDTMAIEILYIHRMQSVSIHGYPIHSNISQYIA